MIGADSRYADSTLVVLSKNGTVRQTIVPSPQQAYSFTYNYYMVTGHDTVDSLAFNVFGDATFWWKIADANPEIMMWDSLEPGTLIRIPVNL